MRLLKKRLACLNLALLLLVLSALPAAAAPVPSPAPADAAARRSFYTLYLNPNGGTQPNGATSAASISAQRPYQTVDLADYLCTQSNKIQVGWTTNRFPSPASPSNLIPINARYRVTNTTLYAYWAPSGSTLNALSGTFVNPSPRDGAVKQQRYSIQTPGHPLPTAGDIRYTNGSALLGWSTRLQPEADANSFLSGAWYAPGDSAPKGPLYGHQYSPTASHLVVYHLGSFPSAAGGSALVQEGGGNSDIWPLWNLSYLLPEPKGWSFGGWSTEPGSTEIAYGYPRPIVFEKPGVLNLYAIWYKQLDEKSYLNAYLPSEGNTVRVLINPSFYQENKAAALALALYDRDSGQLLGLASKTSSQSGGIEAKFPGSKLPRCKLIAWDKYGAPVIPPYSFDAEQLMLGRSW